MVRKQELIKIGDVEKETFYNKYQQNNNHSTLIPWTEYDQQAQFIENNKNKITKLTETQYFYLFRGMTHCMVFLIVVN